jgi:hypothetical protein
LESRAERLELIPDSGATGASHIIDVSRASSARRTFLQGVRSLAGAAGLALLVPFAILVVGLPVAIVIRGLLEAVGWLTGVSLP